MNQHLYPPTHPASHFLLIHTHFHWLRHSILTVLVYFSGEISFSPSPLSISLSLLISWKLSQTGLNCPLVLARNSQIVLSQLSKQEESTLGTFCTLGWCRCVMYRLDLRRSQNASLCQGLLYWSRKWTAVGTLVFQEYRLHTNRVARCPDGP